METPLAMRVVREHRGVALLAAAVLPLAVCALLTLWRDEVTNATAVLVLVLLVVLAAATGDRLAGVVAAVAGAVGFDFFLTEPFNQLAVDDPDDLEAAVLLVVIGLAVTEVALWGHRQQARASRRSGYLDGVLSVAETALTTPTSPDDVIASVARQIEAVLGIDRCRFVEGQVSDRRLAVLRHDGVVTRGGRTLDVDDDGLPTEDETALVVGPAGAGRGYFVLTASTAVARPSLEQRKVAVLLADQVAPLVGRRPE